MKMAVKLKKPENVIEQLTLFGGERSEITHETAKCK